MEIMLSHLGVGMAYDALDGLNVHTQCLHLRHIGVAEAAECSPSGSEHGWHGQHHPPAHFLRGEMSEEFQHSALVYGKDLLCLNDGRNGEKLVHQQAVCRLGILFAALLVNVATISVGE